MELYETEKSFISVLETISIDYCEALKDQPGLEDLRHAFEITNKLLPLHNALRDGFKKCAESKTVDTNEVAQLFFGSECELLQYGMYAAYLPEAQEKVTQCKMKCLDVVFFLTLC
jgi:hypothetical protein